jgi:hypothetical protein
MCLISCSCATNTHATCKRSGIFRKQCSSLCSNSYLHNIPYSFSKCCVICLTHNTIKLITQTLLNRFNEIGNQNESETPLVIAKFFNPCGSGTWYATVYALDTLQDYLKMNGEPFQSLNGIYYSSFWNEDGTRHSLFRNKL